MPDTFTPDQLGDLRRTLRQLLQAIDSGAVRCQLSEIRTRIVSAAAAVDDLQHLNPIRGDGGS